jgi:hypothetical protein
VLRRLQRRNQGRKPLASVTLAKNAASQQAAAAAGRKTADEETSAAGKKKAKEEADSAEDDAEHGSQSPSSLVSDMRSNHTTWNSHRKRTI